MHASDGRSDKGWDINTTRKKGLRDEIFQIRRLSNNLRDEIIFRLLSEHLWDETGFLS